MNRVVAMLLAGGQGSRLGILSAERAKPAVPFAGIYRIIDFTLSNCMHAGIPRVGILTQYLPGSLMEHVGQGRPWEYTGRLRQVSILPPTMGYAPSDWYRGTADAVYQNRVFIRQSQATEMLVLSGDHIYKMDYRPMVEFHRRHGGALSVATMEVSPQETHRFGIAEADGDGRIRAFHEKPRRAPSRLASLGIYVFNTRALLAALEDNVRKPDTRHDFGHDVIPLLVDRGQAFAYRFEGYWRDVGTIASYMETSRDVLGSAPPIDLAAWAVRTNLDDRDLRHRPPTAFRRTAEVESSLVSRGCSIAGIVRRSILGPGVRVRAGALVEDSVVMHDADVGGDVRLLRAILDKDVVVAAGACLGDPADRASAGASQDGFVSVGKAARLGRGVRLEAGASVPPGTVIASGRVVHADG